MSHGRILGLQTLPLGHSKQWCEPAKFPQRTVQSFSDQYRAPCGRQESAALQRSAVRRRLVLALWPPRDQSAEGSLRFVASPLAAVVVLDQPCQLRAEIYQFPALWPSKTYRPCPADNQRIYLAHQISDHANFVANFCTSQNCDKGRLGIFQSLAQILQLLFHEQSSG